MKIARRFSFEKITKANVLTALFLFAILFRLLIAVKMPIRISMQAGYDDALSINQALHILDGKWLGGYNAGVLTKGLSFTFFLLVNHFSKLSYPLFLCLFNIGAAFTILKALAPLIKNKKLSAAGFLFLVYSPATLTSDFSLRVYRNSVIFAAVLLVLAGILGLYLRRKASFRKRLPWSILLMIAFPFFWFLREDSIWLMPLFIVATLFTFYGIIVENQQLGPNLKEGAWRFWNLLKTMNRKKLIANTLLLVAPLLVTFGEAFLIAKTNHEHYGIFTTNDRTKTSFAKLTENLIQIDNSEYDSKAVAENNGIWVSKKTFAKAQKVSPTLRKYRDGIDWIYNESIWPNAWKIKKGEMAGDMFVWGIREMFQREGLYTDGEENEKVFKKINEELEKGFKSGQLKRKKMLFISKQSNGKKFKDLVKVFNYLGAGMLETTVYKSYETKYGSSYFMEDQPAKDILDLLNIKSVATEGKSGKAEAKRTKPITWIFNSLIWLYRIVSPILLLFSFAAIVLFTTAFIKKKKRRAALADYMLIFLGLLLTYFLYLFGVSWFATWAPDGKEIFMSFYTGAGVPLIQVVEILGLALIVRNAKGELFETKLGNN